MIHTTLRPVAIALALALAVLVAGACKDEDLTVPTTSGLTRSPP